MAVAGKDRPRPVADRLRRPELLAPAGDWDCAKAAVENGADAIYFGLEKFNARMRARNFIEADLPRLVRFLHARGVKGYVTFNTLVFDNEMAEAEQYARAIISAGIDAAIVQDVGICRLIRALSPDFPIHVSTQMTITSEAGMEFARALRCNLVVLARECSLKELEIIQGLEAAEAHPMPLEVFVHGALCVAYSGQCLTSEALGGRSANRGECAQACRMPYELISDGHEVPLGARKYLLSPQDLAGLELLPELVRLGVASLKIEGRLKSPEYVANITRIYRQALDRLFAAGTLPEEPPRASTPPAAALPLVGSEARYEMEMAFSRGLYTGWFRGVNNQQLVHAHFGKKRGVYLGQVAAVNPDGVVVHLEGPLQPGDGVVFDAGKPEEKEQGGRVYEIKHAHHKLKLQTRSPGPNSEQGLAKTRPALLTFGHGDLDLKRIRAGDKVWKTSDPELERRLRQSFAGETPRFQRGISVEAHGLAGKPLTLIVRDEAGRVVRVDSAIPLELARNQPLSTERLRQQLGRSGGTPFRLGDLRNFLGAELVLPVSELNRLRREAVRQLEELRAQTCRWSLRSSKEPPTGGATAARESLRLSSQSSASQPQLTVLVRSLGQLDAALQAGVQTVYCELEDLKNYREAVARFRAFHRGTPAGTQTQSAGVRPALFLAPPRIFKMGEEWTLKQVRSAEPDGYLLRNYDHLKFFDQGRRIGDYSFNIANRLSAEYFKNHFILERLTASYDLNVSQLDALLRSAPPEWFEVTIHQHMPMFHMEHCVFCAFLSDGTDYTNCGRPCDKHDVRLRDRVGAQHPVKADAGCRNTVYNALAQTGAESVPRLLSLGARHFRLEFLTETPGQVSRTIGQYQLLLEGKITGDELWRDLKLLNQLGVTRGQLNR